MGKPNRNGTRLFVTGTDTGVGKTVLSLLLMQFLYDAHQNPFYIKPIQTGCRDPYDAESDARFIYDHVPVLKGRDPGDSVVYCFKNPKAPYFAARDEGKHIDLKVIEKFVDEKSSHYSHVILEGAGGLLVPVSDEVPVIDLVGMFRAQPILAARAGLGTINHTLLSLEALKSRGIAPATVVLMDSGNTPTPPDMIAENIEAIERASEVKVAGVIGRIDDFSIPSRENYQALQEHFVSFIMS